MNKAKNDSKLIEEMVRVREAKQELREFEKTMGGDLPNRKKLKEFRSFAKEIIENKPNYTRRGRIERTEEEEKRLTLKIRELQEKYPHVDMTQLFDTDRAEDARKALHKKAYASYKAYEFLKAGLKVPG